jgi:SAM-dependent methyltransferase
MLQTDTYDALPYYCEAQPHTHPDHLAAIAALHGIAAPPPETCRALELGCGDGTNLMAIAQSLPRAKLHGIDRSARQIAAGRARLQKLGLAGASLECRDLADYDPADQRFDYIIAHGVYSWTDAPGRVLELCAQALTPGGIAYISYNIRPGWNMRGTLRDMLRYHTGPLQDLESKLEQMRAWQAFLEQAGQGPTSYHAYLLEENASFKGLLDSYLFHEFLETHNQPVYFHEFMDQAGAHGLHYLGEASPALAFRPFELPATLCVPGPLGRIQAEQYLDFLENGQFRKTLLCRQPPPLPPISAETLAPLYVASPLRPLEFPAESQAQQQALASPAPLAFDSLKVGASEDSPLVKTALYLLGQRWPSSLRFDELFRAACERLPGVNVPGPDYLADKLMQYFQSEALIFRLGPPRYAAVPGEQPLASPLVRLQCREGRRGLCNLRGEEVAASPVARQLLPYLDGQRQIGELVGTLEQWIASGQLIPPPSAMRQGKADPEILARQAALLLQRFAEDALLIA